MKSWFSFPQPHSQRVLFFTSLLALAAGVFFHFCQIDSKVYWVDEVYSSLRIIGETEGDIKPRLKAHAGEIRTLGDLRSEYKINEEGGFSSTLHSLYVDDPHHCPLYYLMSRVWAKITEPSPYQLRLFSVLLSLLAIPTMLWLCFEFGLALTPALFITALLSLSPLLIIYAQQAREYGFWCAVLLAWTAALIRACKTNSFKAWSAYALLTCVAPYTYLFSAIVIPCHALYIWVKFKTPLQPRYIGATLLGLLGFAPWGWVVISKTGQVVEANYWSIDRQLPLTDYVQLLFLNITRPFLDMGLTVSSRLSEQGALFGLSFLVLLIIFYSLWSFRRRHPSPEGLLLIALVLFMLAGFLLLDLLKASRTATVPRYMMMSWTSLIFIVGLSIYLWMQRIHSDIFDAPLAKFSGRAQHALQQVQLMMIIAPFVFGGMSLFYLFGKDRHAIWTTHPKEMVESINILKSQPEALLVTSFPGNLIQWTSMAYALPPERQWLAVMNPEDLNKVPIGTAVYFYRPAEWLLEIWQKTAQQSWTAHPVQSDGFLWKIIREK